MENTLKKYFPNAIKGEDAVQLYLDKMQKEYGIDLATTLFATSICSDDANFSADFGAILNRPFVMGGLGGLPYTGFTGMVAYGHHIPDNGTAFIFYGPHIGINKAGEVGRMKRWGQEKDSNSCGALMLALDRLITEEHEDVYIPLSTEIDYQQILLERMMMPFKNEILSHQEPKVAITEKTYLVTEHLLKKCIAMAKDEFHTDKIVLLGGIIINTDHDLPDLFDVRNFEVLQICDVRGIVPADVTERQAFKDL